MTRVTDKYAQRKGSTVFLCDFSSPRGADPCLLEPVRYLDADFISVSYNPGKFVTANSAMAAAWIRQNTGKEVVFSLATRDMNRLALQSLLLGAEVLGLENVLVLKGDDFTAKQLTSVKAVHDFTPTGLLESVSSLNEGLDYRGLTLRSPTGFCVGASIDLGKGIEREVSLTRRKVEAGAQFFVMQTVFDPGPPKEFLGRYAERYGEELAAPVFCGVQVMAKDSLVFGDVPQWIEDDLAKDRPGQEIALQLLGDFTEAGFESIYLVPPIIRKGGRDYEAAQAVLEAFRK